MSTHLPPSHYDVLNIAPGLLDTDSASISLLLKRAYHRALLTNHPDKQAASSSTASQALPTAPADPFSVDQITEAWKTLSSPKKRAEYDAKLRLSRGAAACRPGEQGGGGENFQTGIENIDLDDMEFDEKLELWYRPCRCGNEKGFRFKEDDLAANQEDGILMVGCEDCSLWLGVHFAVMDEDAQ